MISEKDAIVIALRTIAKTFGNAYCLENVPKSPNGMWYGDRDGNMNVMFYWVGFATAEARPDLTPDYKGWTVTATARVDMETGASELVDYILPDGTKGPNKKQ